MAIPNFYYPDFSEVNESVVLSGEEAHHAIKSRRLCEGQQVQLLNGRGLIGSGRIVRAEHRNVHIAINDTALYKRPADSLTMATAIPKGDRQKVMVDMLTQLGTKEIVPLACEHSVTRYRPKMHDKWQRWAIEACKQSCNPWVPDIDEGISLTDLIKIAADRLLYADATGEPLAEYTQSDDNLIVVIGPEGGFSPAEHKLFSLYQVNSVSLGRYILRTEAAAVAAASQWALRSN